MIATEMVKDSTGRKKHLCKGCYEKRVIALQDWKKNNADRKRP
jgi:hypothetical protein